MKIIKTMLLACLLGGSVGAWAMEHKEEQKSQYDNSPRQQTTEIQKSKDGKDVTVFGRKTFYGFTAEELKAIPLVQALEKYDLDFTRVKRERVPEGTDLGQVFMFDDQDLCKTIDMHKVVEKDQVVESITFGTKVIGYVFRDKDCVFYNSKVFTRLLEFCQNFSKERDTKNQSTKETIIDESSDSLLIFLNGFFPHFDIAYISVPDIGFGSMSKVLLFQELLYKQMNPMVKLYMPEYSSHFVDPLKKSYNSNRVTYEDRHGGKFPQTNLRIEKRIIESIPLVVNIEHGDSVRDNEFHIAQDTIRLANERGLRPNIICSFLFGNQINKSPNQCMQEMICKHLDNECFKKRPNPLYGLSIDFLEHPWEEDWIQEVFQSIPFLFDKCNRGYSAIFSINLEELVPKNKENSLSFFRPQIMANAKANDMVIDFFTEQSGKSRVTITPKKFFLLNSMKAIKSEIGKIYVKEDGTSRKQVFRKEVAWDVLRVCYSKDL